MTLHIQRTAERLNAIQDARTTTSQAIGEALHSLMRAYSAAERSLGYSTGLQEQGALGGAPATELNELVEHLTGVSQSIAEVALVLLELYPDPVHFVPGIDVVRATATDGMRVRRLEQWEKQALRSVVVKALAGDEKK